MSAAPSDLARSPEQLPEQPRLRLYYEESCGYCRDVLRALEPLELSVELVDIADDPRARSDLLAARGRGTVPVLRVGDGEISDDRWKPESLDIIRELRRLAGVSPPVPPWFDRVVQLSRPIGLGMMFGSIFVQGTASNWLMGAGLAVFALAFIRRMF